MDDFCVKSKAAPNGFTVVNFKQLVFHSLSQLTLDMNDSWVQRFFSIQRWENPVEFYFHFSITIIMI